MSQPKRADSLGKPAVQRQASDMEYVLPRWWKKRRALIIVAADL
jgi:hypothetical protein